MATIINNSSNLDITTETSQIETGVTEQAVDSSNLRRVPDDDNEGSYLQIRVGKFDRDGFIVISGDYPQNTLSIPKFNLSDINKLNNQNALFNFILVIKNGSESEPDIYASNKVYSELIENYNQNNPIPTNYIIHERKIVVIDIKPLLESIEDLRAMELGINLNGGNGFVEVYRNLMVYSNYEADGTNGLKANPEVRLVELIKYISWVISKPAAKYDDRLLDTTVIGSYKDYITSDNEEPDSDTPPEETTQQYPPFERPGAYNGESMVNNSIEYIWSELLDKWVIYNDEDTQSGNTGSGNQSGNTGSGNQGGNTGSGNQGGGGFDPRDES
jgi:uncharacterized membrane protein YgcG